MALLVGTNGSGDNRCDVQIQHRSVLQQKHI